MASEPTVPARTYRKADHQHKEVAASSISMSGIAGNVTTTGTWIKSYGYNQASVHVKFTADPDAGTAADITFNIEATNDTGEAYLIQSASVSTGVATLTNLQYLKASANADISYIVDFPINYGWFRVKSFTVGGGVAGDTYSVSVNLGNL